MTKNEFDQLVNRGKLTIVKFFGEWCGPCKVLGETLYEITSENENVSVIELDVDEGENDELLSTFNVRAIPLILFFKNGEMLKRSTGLMTKEEINNVIKENS